MKPDIAKPDKKLTGFSIVILSAVIIVNHDSLVLLGRIIGLLKQ